jgi:histidyl-tRNA synthetase
MPGLSGVGISFGADRIFDVLNTLDLYPKETVASTRLLFINFGDKETAYCMPIAQQCRHAGISCEIYPDKAKMKKQMAYANAKGIQFVALAGENEIAQNVVTLKNMETGEQQSVTADQLLEMVK